MEVLYIKGLIWCFDFFLIHITKNIKFTMKFNLAWVKHLIWFDWVGSGSVTHAYSVQLLKKQHLFHWVKQFSVKCTKLQVQVTVCQMRKVEENHKDATKYEEQNVSMGWGQMFKVTHPQYSRNKACFQWWSWLCFYWASNFPALPKDL